MRIRVVMAMPEYVTSGALTMEQNMLRTIEQRVEEARTTEGMR